MAAFMEKFHVSIRDYMYKMPVPMITMMIIDSPKVIYGKLKAYSAAEEARVKQYNSRLKIAPITLSEILKNGRQ